MVFYSVILLVALFYSVASHADILDGGEIQFNGQPFAIKEGKVGQGNESLEVKQSRSVRDGRQVIPVALLALTVVLRIKIKSTTSQTEQRHTVNTIIRQYF
ncbi:hypothetical protein [Escherichia coli]|uniref:hypothetical protein n=1 Tax=Escherichia TaxID=561 RepID=UPI003855CC8A